MLWNKSIPQSYNNLLWYYEAGHNPKKQKGLKNKGKEKTRYFMKCADPFMNTKIGKKSLWNSTNKENHEIIL